MYAIENKNTGKLLVAILAMFMIIAGAAIVFGDNVSAADQNFPADDDDDGIIELDSETTYNLSEAFAKDVTVNGNGAIINVTQNIAFYGIDVIFKDVTINSALSGMVFTASANTNASLTFDNVEFNFTSESLSTIYVDEGNSATFNECKFTGVTVAYIQSANTMPQVTFTNCTGSPDVDLQTKDPVQIGSDLILTGSTLGNVEMYDTSKIVIPQGETFTAESISPAEDANPTIDVLGALNADISTIPEKNITTTPDSIINGQTGKWDEVKVSGTLSSAIDGDANQRIIVTDDLTISGDKTISVKGELVVEEGAILTITGGAYVNIEGNANAYIYGDVVVEQAPSNNKAFTFNSTGKLTIDGSMTLNAANAFESKGTTVIGGTFTISDEASAAFQETTVTTDGTIEINGQATGSVTNNGNIIIDTENLGTTSSEMFSIEMGETATVNVLNLSGWIEISDNDLTFNYQNKPKEMENNNRIVIDSVRGVSISESVTYKNDKTEGRIGTNVMVISGTMIPGDNGTDVDVVNPALGIAAESYVTIGEGTSFGGITVNVNGNLDVPVDVMANSEDTKIAGIGTITVTGSITTLDPISTTTVNAAMYQTEKTTEAPTSYYIYTTLENALASGATKITVTGNITVKENIEIPVGTTVDSTKATVNIDEAATVTVLSEDKKSGEFDNGIVNVNGTLVAQNASKGIGNENVVYSDTAKTSGNSKTWTNIYNALENAVDGETVTVTKTNGNVVVNKDVEVKDGVTLSVPTSKGITIDYGATVTVNGTANIVGSYSMNIEDDTKTDGKTIVNGMFLYSNGADYTEQIAGAYFMYNGVNAISTLENTASIINDVQSNNVTVYGENTAGDIAFDYTGDFMTLVVDTNAVLNAGTLDMGSVGFQADGCFTGTLEFTNGSVVLNEVKGISASDAVSYDGDAQIYTATVSGDAAYGGTIADGKGSVSFVGAVSSEADYAANVPVSVPTGSTLTVTAGTIDDVSVEGTVEVTGAPTFNKAVVLGTLNVALGKSVSVGTLYAGVSIVDGAVSDNTAAVVSEGVSITGTAYVGPNADIADKVLTGISKITEYYVDDVVYVTAYDRSTDGVYINAITVDSPDAKFVQWNKADGTAVSAKDKIGSPDKVYAELDYNICPVEVLDIPGVSVYIDGKEFNQSNFPNGMVSVGEHTIDVYVTPGWTGEPVITVNGQTVTDGKFTASADQTTTIQITGVTAGQATTSSGDDGLGLTDILLIILVVLIVIMAIMVAMRLMRS